ncbi:hypothetical protein ACLMJK_006419 [Lecanora helva]
MDLSDGNLQDMDNAADPMQLKDVSKASSDHITQILNDSVSPRDTPHSLFTLSNPPSEDLGILDRLPLELAQALLSPLDLRTLTSFRCVNRRAKEVTDSIPQFRHIQTYAPVSLRKILSAGTSRWISCNKLSETISMTKCEDCDNNGEWLYILTCKRLCHSCLISNTDYLPLSSDKRLSEFKFRESDLNGVPHMKFSSDMTTQRNLKHLSSHVLFDYPSAFEAGVAIFGSASRFRRHACMLACRQNNERIAKAKASGSYARRLLRKPLTLGEMMGRPSDPIRFAAVVPAPI